MNVIGLMTVRCENDIVDATLARNAEHVDAIYALTDRPLNHPKIRGQWSDDDLPNPPYARPTDGCRQWLLERAIRDHGPGNLFVLLHADEVWLCDPREVADDYPDADGFLFRLPCYLPPAEWLDDQPPLAQLSQRLEPGWPEFRMFRGRDGVHWPPAQHFDTRPVGLRLFVQTGEAIAHLPYRSPESIRARAAATWDPDNYEGLGDGWHGERVQQLLASDHYTHLVEEPLWS